jgi:hypothetical protein
MASLSFKLCKFMMMLVDQQNIKEGIAHGCILHALYVQVVGSLIIRSIVHFH